MKGSDKEILEYILSHEFECKCCSGERCHGCQIGVLKDEIGRKNDEVALLKEKLKEAVIKKVGPRQRHVESIPDNPEQ